MNKFRKRKWQYLFYEVLGFIATVFLPRKGNLVFVIGTGRCGTTLLNRILKTNQSLVIFPGEANEYFHAGLFPYTQKARKLAPSIIEDPAAFSAKSLLLWNNRRRRRMRRVFTGYAWLKGFGKPLVVKSAMISFFVEPLHELFPDARFIHLYRHGLPVVNSIFLKEKQKLGRYFDDDIAFREAAAKYWNSCILEIERAKRRVGSKHFLELSYEFLCTDVAAAMLSIADFTGIPGNFAFDVHAIDNRNAKSGTLECAENEACLMLMREALTLKKYYQ